MHELVTVNTDRINARFNYEIISPITVLTSATPRQAEPTP